LKKIFPDYAHIGKNLAMALLKARGNRNLDEAEALCRRAPQGF
jgi:hypothetical protein